VEDRRQSDAVDGKWSSRRHAGTSLAVVDEVEIVRIGPDEWREFREVRLASLSDAPGAFGASHGDWVDAEESRWRQRLVDVPFTLVARSAVTPVGVVSGVGSGDVVELISMWVAPAHRGTGLAGRLIGQVVAWAAGRGLDTVLMVRDDNEAAIRSYARAGFVDLGIPDGWPADVPLERRMRHSSS
jgi:GNAT superfamily N-acetyltransferase